MINSTLIWFLLFPIIWAVQTFETKRDSVIQLRPAQ
jgi:hypothetical protein